MRRGRLHMQCAQCPVCTTASHCSPRQTDTLPPSGCCGLSAYIIDNSGVINRDGVQYFLKIDWWWHKIYHSGKHMHFKHGETVIYYPSFSFTVNVFLEKPRHYKQSWWRHQMETFSALLALCAGNSSVTGEFPSQRPVTRSFEVFFDLCLNKRLSKQLRRRRFETPSRSLWRYCVEWWQAFVN